MSFIYSAYKTWSRRMADVKPLFTIVLAKLQFFPFRSKLSLFTFYTFMQFAESQHVQARVLTPFHSVLTPFIRHRATASAVSVHLNSGNLIIFCSYVFYIVMVCGYGLVFVTYIGYGKIGLSFVSLTWKAAFVHSGCICPWRAFVAACDRSNRTCLPYYGKQA